MVETKKPEACAPSFQCSQCVRLFWQRANQHNHLATFHLRHIFTPANFLSIFCNAQQQIAAQFLVCHLAALKAQGNFNLVAIFQKLEHIAHFDFIVMLICVRSEFNLFDFNDLLFLARFGFFLLGFVFEFPKVHNLANRWIGIW